MRFEYKWIRHKGKMVDLITELNELGQERWEVIYFNSSTTVDVLLKRMKIANALVD